MDVRVEDRSAALVKPGGRDRPAPIIFGAGGDLTKRLLMPAI
jgi:hypothetical protein